MLMALEDPAVYTRGQPEIVRINNESAQVASVAGKWARSSGVRWLGAQLP